MKVSFHNTMTPPRRVRFGAGQSANGHPDPKERHMQDLIMENRLLRQERQAEGGYLRRLVRNCLLGASLGGALSPFVQQMNLPTLNTVAGIPQDEVTTSDGKIVSDVIRGGGSAGVGTGLGAVLTRKRIRKDKREAEKLQA